MACLRGVLSAGMTGLPSHLVFCVTVSSSVLACMAGSLVCLPLSLCLTFLSFQVGWRKRPTIDLNPPRRRPHLPCPQPRTAHSGPPFCTLGGGAFSPRGPPLSLWPSLLSHTLVTSHFSLSSPSDWLLSPHSPCLSSSLFCVSPVSPSRPCPLFPTWALFYSPQPRPLADAISGSNSEQLSNISVGREKLCLVVLASQCRGQTGHPLPVPRAGWLTWVASQSVYLLGVPQNFPWCRIMDFGF